MWLVAFTGGMNEASDYMFVSKSYLFHACQSYRELKEHIVKCYSCVV